MCTKCVYLAVCLDDINDSDDDSEWCCVDCYGVLPLNFGAILMFTSITIVGLILVSLQNKLFTLIH